MDKKGASTLADIGEFGLIDRIRARFPAPEGVTGIGDDCAVLPQKDGMETLVSTDMLVEGTHFLRDDIPPYRLGWKSAAVNLSDIAAMGGSPVGTFLSVAFPADLEAGWVEEFLRGYGDLCGRFDTPLLGGDTTASPDRICINVAVLGECPAGGARRRSGALPGDLICVTGTLGDSAAGLKAILEGVERDADVQALIDRHYLPLPRVEEGLRLAATPGVHAMMDLSDGLGSDLRHILNASSRLGRAAAAGAEKIHSLRSETPLQQHPAEAGAKAHSPGPETSPQHPAEAGTCQLNAKIDPAAIPLSPALKRACTRLGWDAVALAVGGGEDYELLFTVDPEAEKTLGVPHTVIGTICREQQIIENQEDSESLYVSNDPIIIYQDTDCQQHTAHKSFCSSSGFDHFRKG